MSIRTFSLRSAVPVAAAALLVGSTAGAAHAAKPVPQTPSVSLDSVVASGATPLSIGADCGWVASYTPSGLNKGTKYSVAVHEIDNVGHDIVVYPLAGASARDNDTQQTYVEASDGAYRIRSGDTRTFYVVISAVSHKTTVDVATSGSITTTISCV